VLLRARAWNGSEGTGDLGDNRSAVGLYGQAIEILERLVNVEDRRELANDLATFYTSKAVALSNLGYNRAAAGFV
jgi:hypothetical protein